MTEGEVHITGRLDRKPSFKERLRANLRIGLAKTKEVIRATPANIKLAAANAETKYNKALTNYEGLLERAEKKKKEAKHQESKISELLRRTEKVLKPRKVRATRKRKTRATKRR